MANVYKTENNRTALNAVIVEASSQDWDSVNDYSTSGGDKWTQRKLPYLLHTAHKTDNNGDFIDPCLTVHSDYSLDYTLDDTIQSLLPWSQYKYPENGYKVPSGWMCINKRDTSAAFPDAGTTYAWSTGSSIWFDESTYKDWMDTYWQEVSAYKQLNLGYIRDDKYFDAHNKNFYNITSINPADDTLVRSNSYTWGEYYNDYPLMRRKNHLCKWNDPSDPEHSTTSDVYSWGSFHIDNASNNELDVEPFATGSHDEVNTTNDYRNMFYLNRHSGSVRFGIEYIITAPDLDDYVQEELSTDDYYNSAHTRTRGPFRWIAIVTKGIGKQTEQTDTGGYAKTYDLTDKRYVRKLNDNIYLLKDDDYYTIDSNDYPGTKTYIGNQFLGFYSPYVTVRTECYNNSLCIGRIRKDGTGEQEYLSKSWDLANPNSSWTSNDWDAYQWSTNESRVSWCNVTYYHDGEYTRYQDWFCNDPDTYTYQFLDDVNTTDSTTTIPLIDDQQNIKFRVLARNFHFRPV